VNALHATLDTLAQIVTLARNPVIHLRRVPVNVLPATQGTLAQIVTRVPTLAQRLWKLGHVNVLRAIRVTLGQIVTRVHTPVKRL